MFKKSGLKPAAKVAKWGTEPKGPASGKQKPPQTTGAGYTGCKAPKSNNACYPTSPSNNC